MVQGQCSGDRDKTLAQEVVQEITRYFTAYMK